MAKAKRFEGSGLPPLAAPTGWREVGREADRRKFVGPDGLIAIGDDHVGQGKRVRSFYVYREGANWFPGRDVVDLISAAFFGGQPVGVQSCVMQHGPTLRIAMSPDWSAVERAHFFALRDSVLTRLEQIRRAQQDSRDVYPDLPAPAGWSKASAVLSGHPRYQRGPLTVCVSEERKREGTWRTVSVSHETGRQPDEFELGEAIDAFLSDDEHDGDISARADRGVVVGRVLVYLERVKREHGARGAQEASRLAFAEASRAN